MTLAPALAARVRRRPDPESDAVRVPGAVAQGAVARGAGPRRRGAHAHQGLAFAAGVVVTFVALAGAAARAARRRRAARLGLPAAVAGVVAALAVLFFVLALNLSGVFEFGDALRRRGGRLSPRNRYADAFLSGVLAVVVASPCTAPFMGAALGYALASRRPRRSPSSSRSASAWRCRSCCCRGSPAGGACCRRPGAWMERLKQLLAFPLYATVAWLVWVLGAQVDNDAVVRLLVTLVVVAFALWAWRAYRGGGSRGFASSAPSRSRRRWSSRGRCCAATPVATPAPRAGARRPQRPRGSRRSPARVARADRGGQAGVRRLHRGVVRHLPGEQAARAERRRGAARRSRGATSRWCAPTGRAATPRSRRRWPRSAATACRSTCCIGPAANRCCCRRCCSRDSSTTRSPRFERTNAISPYRRSRSCTSFCARSRLAARVRRRRGARAAPGSAGARLHARPTSPASRSSSPTINGKYVVLEWTNPDCPFVRNHYRSGNMQAQQKSWAQGRRRG